MKYLLIPLLALGVSSAAFATAESPPAPSAAYPACSKTVTDECTQTAAKPAHHASGKAMHHRAHHRAVKKAG